MGRGLSCGLITSILMLLSEGAAGGQCIRVARDCIEPGGTREIDGLQVFKECWRYKDVYKCTGYARNDCVGFDEEPFCQLDKTTCKEQIGAWCVAQVREYKCQETEKYIRQEKRYRLASVRRGSTEERRHAGCTKAPGCIDGKCFDMSYEGNDEMISAAGMLATLKEMQGNLERDVSIFKGRREHCDKKVTSYTSCCDGMGGWGSAIGARCKEKDQILAKARKEGKCVEIGKYCASKKLGICLIERTVYCCYDSKIAKEINEQARNKGLVRKGWGSVKSADCSGFSVEELQNLNFSAINFDFLSEDIKKGGLWSKMGGMEKALEHTKNLLSNEVEAIKEDVTNVGGGKFGVSGTADQIDETKLYEKKFNEIHHDVRVQKKPDGRDRTRDIHEENETIYSTDDDKKRDEKGL
ncbi:hypothetical protein EDM53_01550 [Rickettsiales endosymbiont of Peranema trichophorum]|uniref:conjugal transfer protein TraN n=1 Tax=Rickettsiales endosymbiont of Peranema trichophorum TaxID=2486577 RepID=UPI00102361EC|nr:conjugal transfer protein TraN [Rickettsiales endosymbiont of Peranema trichophorum]RZI47493.1 hypothetical protein EDM53_01550 [Rickettsiales endosymbiont of Peranema trichophorum]